MTDKPELGKIIKSAFPGKKIVCIVESEESFAIYDFGLDGNNSSRIGMIESARIISRVLFSKSMTERPTPPKGSK